MSDISKNITPDDFKRKMRELLDLLRSEDGPADAERVRQMAGMANLDDEDWEIIFHYLEINGINITGGAKSAAAAAALAAENAEFAAEDTDLIRELYLENLKDIEELAAGEEKELFKLLAAGDESAFKRLTEVKLALAMETAAAFAGRGIAESDLIQEANLLLMEALAELAAGGSNEEADGGESRDSWLRSKIREGLNALVIKEFEIEGHAQIIAERANMLMEASNALSEELDRPATIEELSKHLGLKTSETEEIMNMMLDAVNVSQEDRLGADLSGTDEEE